MANGFTFIKSSQAWIVPATLVADAKKPRDLLALVTEDGAGGAERLTGFDTFWYNWIAVNETSKLLQ